MLLDFDLTLYIIMIVLLIIPRVNIA